MQRYIGSFKDHRIIKVDGLWVLNDGNLLVRIYDKDFSIQEPFVACELNQMLAIGFKGSPELVLPEWAEEADVSINDPWSLDTTMYSIALKDHPGGLS